LAEDDLKPWRKDMWCIPQVDAEYVARMEDVLEPPSCFDESPIQLIGEVRAPIPPRPGQLERYDCEYKRNGTANLRLPRTKRRLVRYTVEPPTPTLRSMSSSLAPASPPPVESAPA
jgi:hypothetical protein